MDVADQLQDAAVNADCPCDNARDDPKACGRAADGLPNPRSDVVGSNHDQNYSLPEVWPLIDYRSRSFQFL
jgi:hypothetical protein